MRRWNERAAFFAENGYVIKLLRDAAKFNFLRRKLEEGVLRETWWILTNFLDNDDNSDDNDEDDDNDDDNDEASWLHANASL